MEREVYKIEYLQVIQHKMQDSQNAILKLNESNLTKKLAHKKSCSNTY